MKEATIGLEKGELGGGTGSVQWWLGVGKEGEGEPAANLQSLQLVVLSLFASPSLSFLSFRG